MNKINSVFYMYSNMDGRSQILLFLIILIALMLISILVINFITNKKEEKIDKKFNNITRYSNIVKNEEEKKSTDIKKEDVEVVEITNEKNTIEDISRLLEESESIDPIDLTKFEEEQEKDAIISYDELVKRAGAKKIVYKTEEIIEEKIEIIPMPEEKKKFKASQIVSPIYGIQEEKQLKKDIDTFIDLEEFPINEKTTEQDEMKKDIEFLGSLKTFRSNLD